MKKYLHNFKFLTLALGLVLIASIVNAQTKTAIATGNWNSNATWGEAPPTSINDVVINNGVTVTVNVAAACKSIVINTGNTNTGITISNNQSLTVAPIAAIGGGILINPGTDASSTRTISLGNPATLTATSLTMADVGAGFSASTLSVGSGSATITDITMNGAAAENIITVGNGGDLFIGGTVSQATGSITTVGGSNVEYNGAAQTVKPATYDLLTLSGSGAKTFPAGVIINDDLTMNGSASLTTTVAQNIGNDLTMNGTTSVTTGNTFTVVDDITLAAGATLTIGGFDFTATGGNIVINGSIISNSTTGAKSFGNIEINSGGVFNSTANEAYTFSGNLQVDGTGSIVSGTGTWTFNNGGSTLSGSGAATITNATFTQDYTNTGNYTFANLDLSGAGTDFINNGTITVTTTLTGTGEFAQGTSDVLNFGGTSIGVAVLTRTAADNLINYNGAAQNLSVGTYEFLTLSGSGIKTFSALAATTVNDVLSIQGTATVSGVSPVYGSTATILEYKGSGIQSTSNIEFVGTGANPTNLRIDNTAGVTLNAAKIINGALTLTNGYLTTTTTNLLTIGNGGSATTANGSFVNGPLAKQKNTTALFTFPVGNLTGGLRTIGVTPSSNTATTYRASFTSSSPQAAFGSVYTGGITQISACEYWDLSQTSGTTSARVTVSWPAAANTCGSNNWGAYVSNVPSLVVGHRGASNWTNEGQVSTTGSAAAGGTITSTNFLATFSPFVLATTNKLLNPLPVTFSDVKAFEKGTGVQIEWTNLTEKDVLTYTVERSANGRDFTGISQLTSRSNQSDKQSYLSFDGSPLSGTNYYRIKVLEADGKIILSKILKVDIGRTVKGISLYPNPVPGSDISITFAAAKGQYTLRVINNAGQEVYSKQLVHPGGSVSQSVELPASLKTGVYNLMISGDNYRETKMFIMQ